jgi:hypothetical protein
LQQKDCHRKKVIQCCRFLLSLFLVLHGLVHLWYFILSQRFIEFKPEMGWTGRSWLFTNVLGDSATHSLASVFYALAAVAFVTSGIALMFRLDWWRPLLIGSSVFSVAIIFLMWDGRMQLVWNKGLIGALISVVILLALYVLKWPVAAF